MSERKRVIKFDVSPIHGKDLDTVDHLQGFVVEEVEMDEPDAEVIVYIDPMLGRDGSITALERVIDTLRKDASWRFIDGELKQ